MKCPACSKELTEITVNDVKVDACRKGCGGIWFDVFELKKLTDPDESAGESLLDLERDESVKVDHEARKKCPKCDDMIMMRHFYSPEKAVELDSCPSCGGHWLDFGELVAIRRRNMSEDERVEAAKSYFSEIFDVQLAKIEQETKTKTEKVKRISRIFRFITPSWYLKKK